jgi:hypothetical protein
MLSPTGSHVFEENIKDKNNCLTEKTIILNYLLKQISQKSNSYTHSSPLDRFYKRMSGIVSHLSEPLLEAISLQETPIYEGINRIEALESYHLKLKICNILSDLNQILEQSSTKLSPEVIEETLLDALLTVRNEL